MADGGKGHLAQLVSYLELIVEQGRELRFRWGTGDYFLDLQMPKGKCVFCIWLYVNMAEITEVNFNSLKTRQLRN